MSAEPHPPQAPAGRAVAVVTALVTFIWWGVFPIYFKILDYVPPLEILAQRFVWTALFLGLVITWLGRWPQIRRVFGDRRLALALLASSCILSLNWVLFIWAVVTGRVVETSLGYFGTPLASVVLGVVILKEKLNRWQMVAVGLAACAVIAMVIGAGKLPWVSLSLAIIWSLYGFIRKQTPIDAIEGLFMESLLLVPASVVYIVWLVLEGRSHFGMDFQTGALIAASGILTSLPLCGFAFAARRLRLVTLGIFQYITPMLSFLVGVFLYHEPFDTARQVTFGLIWLALIVYTTDAIRQGRRARQKAK